MEQYYNKIAREGSIAFSSQLVLAALNYFIAIFITRALGPEGYGLFSLGSSVIQIATILASFGLGDALVRYLSFYYGRNDVHAAKGVWTKIVRILFSAQLLLTALIILFSKEIASKFFSKPDLTPILIILALSYPGRVLISLIGRAFKAQKELTVPVTLNNIIIPGLKLIFAFSVFYLSLNVIVWSWAYTISVSVAAVIAVFFYRKRILVKWNSIRKKAFSTKALFRFSLPLWASEVLPVILSQLGILLLGYFRTGGEVGIYKIYTFFASIIAMALGAIASIFYPVFSEVVAKEDFRTKEELYQRVTKWYYLITFSISILILGIGLWIIPFMFGEEFRIATPVLLYLIVGIHIANGITGPDGMTLKAEGLTRVVFVTSMIAFVINFGLGFLLVPRFGMSGAATATLCATMASHLVGVIVVKQKMGITVLSVETRSFFFIAIIGLMVTLGINRVADFYNVQLISLFNLGVFLALIIYVFMGNTLDSYDRIVINRFKTKLLALK